MIKRDITETVYKYDNEGKLVEKTVTETHEEEEEKITTSTWRSSPFTHSDSSTVGTISTRG